MTKGHQAALKAIVLRGPDPEQDGVSSWRTVDLCRVTEERFGHLPREWHSVAEGVRWNLGRSTRHLEVCPTRRQLCKDARPVLSYRSSQRGRRSPMAINIDTLTEDELVDLNRRIVERLRFLQHMRAHKQMLEFKVGDRVTFPGDGRGRVEGMLTRYNRRTVTILTDDGQQWNVSPSLVSKVSAAGKKPQAPSNVILLK
ncbi:hypothetical protein ACFQX4_26880 [Roseomonas sp. GCM10028921]